MAKQNFLDKLILHRCQSVLAQGEYWQDDKGVSHLKEVLEFVDLYMGVGGEQGMCN